MRHPYALMSECYQEILLYIRSQENTARPSPPGVRERPQAFSATPPAAAGAFHMVNAFVSLAFTDFC